MNLATIEVDRAEARKQFLSYRTAIREARHQEFVRDDQVIARAYRELSMGKRIINIFDTFASAGVKENGLPQLALARADEPHVLLTCRDARNDDSFAMGPAQLRWGNRQRGDGTADRWLMIPATVLPPVSDETQWRDRFYRAMTPIIPPALRPPHGLRNYHILWEADWHKDRPPVPKDPVLLKHIGGPMYTVLAVWDLTEVERMALGITRRGR